MRKTKGKLKMSEVFPPLMARLEACPWSPTLAVSTVPAATWRYHQQGEATLPPAGDWPPPTPGQGAAVEQCTAVLGREDKLSQEVV